MDPSFFDQEPDINDELPSIPEDLHLQVKAGSNFLPSWFQELDIYANGYVKMTRGVRSDPESHRWFRLFWNETNLAELIGLFDYHSIEHATSVQRERIDGDHIKLIITLNEKKLDVFVDGEFEDHVCPLISSLNEMLPDTMQIYYSYLTEGPGGTS
jgi:hypothetical protein